MRIRQTAEILMMYPFVCSFRTTVTPISSAKDFDPLGVMDANPMSSCILRPSRGRTMVPCVLGALARTLKASSPRGNVGSRDGESWRPDTRVLWGVFAAHDLLPLAGAGILPLGEETLMSSPLAENPDKPSRPSTIGLFLALFLFFGALPFIKVGETDVGA